MWVLGLSCFGILDTIFPPCAIGLDQYSITWDNINIILNNTLGELDQLLLHLEGTDKVPKELSEFIRRDDTKSNAYGNETNTMTEV